MVTFEIMGKEKFEDYLKELFSILAVNMTKILPTGNTYEEDFKCWKRYFGETVTAHNSTVVLIRYNNAIIGFFQYSINENVFYMGEIQISPEYQSENGIFRKLFGYVFSLLTDELLYVESYANKANIKSNGILQHMGLKIIGENKSGRGYCYRGRMSDLYKWYNMPPDGGRHIL